METLNSKDFDTSRIVSNKITTEQKQSDMVGSSIEKNPTNDVRIIPRAYKNNSGDNSMITGQVKLVLFFRG